jgi:hypothetical protein
MPRHPLGCTKTVDRLKLRPQGSLVLSPAIRGHARVNRSSTSLSQIAHVRNAHVAAVQLAPGHQQAIAGSVGPPGQSERQLRKKLTLNCAAQQNGVDPLPAIRWCLASSRFVTTADVAGSSDSTFAMTKA